MHQANLNIIQVIKYNINYHLLNFKINSDIIKIMYFDMYLENLQR